VATDEGWLYLAAVKDMATREIVDWSMADHLRSSLCENALMMAIQRHASPVGLITIPIAASNQPTPSGASLRHLI
jgi:putative transposase